MTPDIVVVGVDSSFFVCFSIHSFIEFISNEDRMVLFKFKNKQKQQAAKMNWIERNQNGQLDVQCWRNERTKKTTMKNYEMKEKVVFFCIEYRRWWIPSMFNWIQSIFFGLQKKDCCRWWIFNSSFNHQSTLSFWIIISIWTKFSEGGVFSWSSSIFTYHHYFERHPFFWCEEDPSVFVVFVVVVQFNCSSIFTFNPDLFFRWLVGWLA